MARFSLGWPWLLIGSGLVGAVAAAPLQAQAFQVFCISNNDGTVTCSGWRGGETLTCVGSRGGVSSCSTPSGRQFTCVVESGGTTTCTDNPADAPGDGDTNCTFTGDGNATCRPPRPPSQPLLPGPRLIPSTGLPSLPTTPPVITNPSVFDP